MEMECDLLRKRLKQELPRIEAALLAAQDKLPAPCRPIAARILGAGGKRLRPFLTTLCARIFGYKKDDVYNLAASMEMLHAATLLHDDVLDNASARRGEPAAHTVFGAARAILAGDAMLACGNAIVASFNAPDLSVCYSRATSETAAGEILEMNSLGNPELTHALYLEIARGKTACLIAQSCALGALLAEAEPGGAAECAAFGENLGIAYQIIDDALDFAPESQTGKPCGGDLREGKMTPVIRLYRESLTPDKRALFDEKFSSFSHSGDDAETRETIAKIAAFANDARRLADECLDAARRALNNLPRGEEREILRQMTDFARERRK